MRNTMDRNTLFAVVFFAIITGGALLSGCSSSSDPDDALFTNWMVQEFVLSDGSTIPVGNPVEYTVEFRTDYTASIRSDCNRCTGSFSADDNRLTFGNLACTLAACEPGSLDTTFQAALSTTSDYRIDSALFLDYEGGVMRLTPVPTLF